MREWINGILAAIMMLAPFCLIIAAWLFEWFY